MLSKKDILSYTLSFCVATLLLVYIFKIPERMTGATVLVNEYYYDNAVQSFFLDFAIIYAYILIAQYVARILHVKDRDRASNTMVVAVTTMLLSSGFMAFFMRQPPKSSFFAKWFRKAGINAVFYDMVIVTSVFIMRNYASMLLCN